MAKKKTKIRIELLERRIEAQTNRIHKIVTDLYSKESKFALNQIPDMRTNLSILFWIMMINDDDFQEFKNALFALRTEPPSKDETNKEQGQWP